MHARLTPILLLVLSGCASTAGSEQSSLAYYTPPDPANWGSDFYWASKAARGRGYCDQTFREELADYFHHRFGSRFERLSERYQETYGTPPDFVIVGGCRQITGSKQPERVRHRRAMVEFGKWLESAEAAIEADSPPGAAH